MVGDQRPSKEQRDQARDTIRAAFATGQIVEADHDQRLTAVDHAQTTTELTLLTQGLAPAGAPSWRAYQAPGAGSRGVDPEPEAATVPPPPSGSSAPLPHVPYGSGSSSVLPPVTSTYTVSTSSSGSWKVGLVIAVVVLAVVGGIAVAIISAVSGAIDDVVDSAGGGTNGLPPGAMHEDGGLEDLVAALQETKGDSMVFDAVLYPDYAVTTATVEPGSQRYQSYYWNGDLQAQTKSTSSYQPFDLADVDDTHFEELCAKVRKLVEDPTGCYVIIRRPGPTDNGAWFAVYASNEYSESARITADQDGKEIDRYVS